MKNRTAFFALIITAALLLNLTACSAPTKAMPEIKDMAPAEILAEAVKNLGEVKSLSYDTNIDISVSSGGKSLNLKLGTAVDCIQQPLTIKASVGVNMGGLESIIKTLYIAENKGVYTVYTDDGSKSDWKVSTTDEFNISAYKAAENIIVFLNDAETFTDSGKEEIDGKVTTRFDGEIRDETIYEVLKNVNVDELVDMGILPEGIDIAELLSDFGSIPVSIWVEDETCIPVKYEMDLTAPVQSLVTKLLGSGILGALGLGDIDISVDRILISMQITNINGIDSIPLPDWVETAA